MRTTLRLALSFAAAATAAQAQTWPPRPGAPAFDNHRYEADQNRAATDRLRLQADQRELEARQHQLDARLTQQRIETQRQPNLASPPAYAPLRTPEEERAWRETATARRQATQAGVGQIDSWLDRKPN